MILDRSRLFSLLLLIFFTACSQEPIKKSGDAPAQVGNNNQSPVEFVNHTIFPDTLLMCNGACSQVVGRDYYAWNMKITFNINSDGTLSVSQQQEPALEIDDDPAQDGLCGAKGSTGNQRNTWLPYTGVFVFGGDLDSIKYQGAKPITLYALSELEDGRMMVINEQVEGVQWTFFPCVGPHRVNSGYRFDTFLPKDAVLNLTTEHGEKWEIQLPESFEPFILLRYHTGAMIPSPMRPVIVTIDLVSGKLVVYYQTTFAVLPPLRKVELKAVQPFQGPAEGETEAQYQTRKQALIDDLNRCPIPDKPIEMCADPGRKPDRRIYTLK